MIDVPMAAAAWINTTANIDTLTTTSRVQVTSPITSIAHTDKD